MGHQNQHKHHDHIILPIGTLWYACVIRPQYVNTSSPIDISTSCNSVCVPWQIFLTLTHTFYPVIYMQDELKACPGGTPRGYSECADCLR